MRIDSHHHCWKLARGDYDWIDDNLTPLNRDFLPDHLQPILTDADIEKTILVQAAETTAETDYILSLAEQQEFIAGIVGWVDMEQATVTHELDRLGKNPWFLGIRPVMQDMEDTEWMLRKSLDPAFQWIINHNKTFDALIKPRHLDTLPKLLARYPAMRVVIDHGAKPDIENGQFQEWADKMSTIAENSNAYCKLSGLVTEAGDRTSTSDLEPYMHHLLKSFGAERLMWGSDWPVINLACDYKHWIRVTDEFVSNLTESERKLILGETARRFYQLP